MEQTDISSNSIGASHALVTSQILQLRGQQLTEFVTMLSNYRNNIDENSTSNNSIADLKTVLKELEQVMSTCDIKINKIRNSQLSNTNTQNNLNVTIEDLQSLRNSIITYRNKTKINKIKWNVSHNNKVTELYLQTTNPDSFPCHFYSNPPIVRDYEDIGCTKMNHKFAGESVLHDDEWIIKIDRINNSQDNSTLADGFIFYTSLNNKIKIPTNLDTPNTQQSMEKVFSVDCTLKHWYQHYNDLKADNKSLAVISNAEENQLAWNALQKSGCKWTDRGRTGGPGMALGGIREGCNDPSKKCTGFKSNKWKWIDNETIWDWTNWSRGEPNNAGSGEPYLMMWDYHDNHFPKGSWNDIYPDHPSWLIPAIYQEYINNHAVDNVTTVGRTQILAIKDIKADNMMAEIDNRTITNTTLRDKLNNSIDTAIGLVGDYDMHNNNFNDAISYYESLKLNAEVTIPKIRLDICRRADLNKSATIETNKNLPIDQQYSVVQIPSFCSSIPEFTPATITTSATIQPFTNLYNSNILNNNPQSNFMNNFLYSNNISEGMSNGNFQDNPYYHYMSGLISNSQKDAHNEARTINATEYNENLNHAQELIGQKENVLSDVLMDYMISKDNGSNAEKVYEKLKSDNNTRLRKIQINEYTTNIYREYINILKFIILLAILVIPAILLNKQGFLNNTLTITYCIILIIIGLIFTGSKLLTLHKRDHINYEKIRVPYNIHSGDSDDKDNALEKRGLGQVGIPGLPCIADQCCGDDPSMVFKENRCVYRGATDSDDLTGN